MPSWARGLLQTAFYGITEPEKALNVANIKSQIKRNKTNEKARLRNKAAKSSLKTAIRKAREATAAGDVEKASVATREASRQLDKAELCHFAPA